MNRRRFLAWLTGTAAGVALAPTLDLDRLLWVPGERKIFIPPIVRPRFSGNVLVTPDWMIKETLRAWQKELEYATQILKLTPSDCGIIRVRDRRRVA